MKLTFILFAFFFNFFNPIVIKAEEIIDSPDNQIEKTFERESLINEALEVKKIHIVKVGETITSISKLYSIKKDTLIKLNNLKDENYIYAGQNLKINDPFKDNENYYDINNPYHIVQEGENLTEISNKYGLKFRELVKFNNLENPDSLEVGSKLFLRKNNIKNQKVTSLINEERITNLITKQDKAYGLLTTQQNKLKEESGRKILNALNQKKKKIIIALSCEKQDLDVRIPGRKWRGWMPAKEEFEKNLLKDFC